jgi:4-hydroxy-4-methyl-2-oxoglutarate aldolase
MTSELSRYSTPLISDALDMLGINGGCEGLRALAPGLSVCGPAYTLAFEEAAGRAAPAADYIDEVPPGSVVVLANQGRTYCTVWGDLLTLTAQKRGLAGTVIDGCCRDAGAILKLGYPMFARGAFMKSGKNRVRLAARNVPVQVAGQALEPEDLVRGDDSGVLLIPRGRVAEVAEICQRIESMEEAVLRDIEQGLPLKASRERHGYNRFALRAPPG